MDRRKRRKPAAASLYKIEKIEKMRRRYNWLGIMVLLLMAVLALDLGGVGSWIADFLSQ